MNAPKSSRQPKRDPWEDLPSAVLVQRLLERRWSAVTTARGVGLALGTSWQIEGDLFTRELMLVVTQGQAGEAAWKALAASHPEGKVNAPSWRAEGTVVRVLVHPGGDSPRLPSVELVPGVTLVTSGTVDAPGSVTEGHTLLRWQRSAHACDLDPPEAPAWLVRLALDDTARAQSVVAALREMPREEGELNPPRLIRFSEPGDPLPRPSRSFDRGDSVELAHALLADLRAQAPDAGLNGCDAVVYDRSTFWVYDPARGVYIERDPATMCRLVAAFAGAPTGPKGKPLSLSDGSIKGAVKAASWEVSRPGFFSGGRKGVAFSNGFVTAQDGKVVAHPLSHEHRALHALSVPYAPDHVPVKWLAMLREVFRRAVPAEELELNDFDAQGDRFDREDTDACIDLLQEWSGVALLGDAPARAVSLLLVGPGNDGKSSVLNVVRSLFPPSSVCSIAPQDWGRSFLAAGLAGKRLNVVSEMPEDDIVSGARFKAVVSGDPITVEHKGRDPFTMIPEAGHIVACNALPPTRDQSAGFWRRFAVIPCERSFTAEEARRDLWREIVEEELAAIAAWAIEGAARAQTLQAFTTPESVRRAKDDWKHDTDQVRQCVEECFSAIPAGSPSSAETTIADLYPVYRAWCGAAGHTPMARNKLASRLKGLGLEHRTKAARLYRLRPLAAWQSSAGLTPSTGGR